MRYAAYLQRSDDAHVEVCEGDNRAEVIAAAQAIYISLVPLILQLGRNVIDAEAGGRSRGGVEEEVKQHALDAKRYGWLVSEHLRAEEWGIAVYKLIEATEKHHAILGDVVFWLGATRDDPTR